ncbi:class II glutamine amidotransferase [Synechococcus sp. BA-132 BA5]|uniref:class II glutamine amidotransferase n=1 Tax=Synechococcus sp. BA-132 BA5 TaxID=3110252 RepID=UPI002B215A7C|nr:class II glutamine amidotransferase [Synechococcus sp. BA-132 BA5]MEA5416996.1 class II glutamine amidotransferase [Synechococcus sp. BA-132 BA5]
MCELLALSANTPTDMHFSFHGLTRRGGATGGHGDGWGVASFDPDGRGVHLYSEAAFCWILGELERAGLDAEDQAGLFEALADASSRLAADGIFNGLISNGRWLFAFARATLADDDLSVDFAKLAGPNDVVTIVSTEPLTTDERWTPLDPGEALLLQGGEVVRHAGPLPRAAGGG